MADVGSPLFISSQAATQMAAQAGFSSSKKVSGTPYTQLQVIVAIAEAESNLDAHAWNKSDPNGGSFGILQINGYWFHPVSGPAINQGGALDPQSAFNYAFRVISGGGNNFGAWSTFSHGLYKSHIRVDAIAASQKVTLPSNGWWKFNITHGYGSFPDTQGHYFQPDNNIFGVPASYPIHAILPGVVTGFHTNDVSYGAVVTVKLDTPLNALATHYVMLHMLRVVVGRGTHVDPGTLLGYGGGNITAGSASASLGFALYPGDDYATGPEFNKYFGAQNKSAPTELDSFPVAQAAHNGTLVIAPFSGQIDIPGLNLNPPGGPGSGGPGGIQAGNPVNPTGNFATGLINKAAAPFSPSDSVTLVLEAIDYALEVINPIPDPNSVQGGNPLFFGLDYAFSWIGAFLYNVFVVDLSALIVRGMIIGFGFYLMFKVANNFINITGTVQNTAKAAETVGMVVAGA